MIVVTGSAGFIGSCLIKDLNKLGIIDLVLVDDFSSLEKKKNINNIKYFKKINRDKFIYWFSDNAQKIEFVYHIGARTDTAEVDIDIFNNLNLNYSKSLFLICTKYDIPFVYASSAATYGMGELGFEDNHNIIEKLKPLNPYAVSKNEFDKWVIKQKNVPSKWVGLKFFNVYGPNEFHKGRMSSVVFNAFQQIKKNRHMKLFKSHKSNFKNGEQARDFVYIKDVTSILIFFFKNKNNSGIYNLGTGIARTFYDLVISTFDSMNIKSSISYIETPIDIRSNYQYFTQANISKLKSIGYVKPFFTLEEGVGDYIREYLLQNRYY